MLVVPPYAWCVIAVQNNDEKATGRRARTNHGPFNERRVFVIPNSIDMKLLLFPTLLGACAQATTLDCFLQASLGMKAIVFTSW